MLHKLNWADLLVIFIALRLIFISASRGFVIELFKFIGIIFSLYIALHYYGIFSGFISRRTVGVDIPVRFLDFVMVISLAVASYVIFVFLRNLFCHFVKAEAVPFLSKWGGCFLGALRAVLTGSLVICIFLISDFNYLNESAKKSFFGRQLFYTAFNTYSGIWNSLMYKFFPDQAFNKRLLDLQDSFDGPAGK